MDRLAGWGVRLCVILLIVSAVPLGGTAIPAEIMTSTGAVFEGSLIGLAPAIRLLEPGSERPTVPGSELEVPLSSIKQITIDFPRVVIEADDQTLIGPFSAFGGIDEALMLKQEGGVDLTIPTASIRAIALNGNPIRPVPREWLGDRFLTGPAVIPTGPLGEEAGCPSCTIGAPSPSDETPIWNTIHPVLPPPEEGPSLPWWLGLIGVAALLVLVYFVTSGTGAG